MPAIELTKKGRIVFAVIVTIAVASTIVGIFVFFQQGERWVSVANWNGQTKDIAMTTEPFKINGSEWRVNWQIWQIGGYTSSASGAAKCDILVYDADTNAMVRHTLSTQSGETWLNTTGRYYLKIGISGTLSSWAVYVYERP